MPADTLHAVWVSGQCPLAFLLWKPSPFPPPLAFSCEPPLPPSPPSPFLPFPLVWGTAASLGKIVAQKH